MMDIAEHLQLSVSTVGHALADDHRISDHTKFRAASSLTTTSLPIQEIAAACGLWLMRRLSTNPADDTAYTSVSPGSVIVRGSTSPADGAPQ